MTQQQYDNLVYNVKTQFVTLTTQHNLLIRQGVSNRRTEMKLVLLSNVIDIMNRYAIDIEYTVFDVDGNVLDVDIDDRALTSDEMNDLLEFTNKLISKNYYTKF